MLSESKLNKYKACTLVIGHVRILNVKFNLSSTTSEQLLIFPNLVEITDHLLIFQAKNVPSLDRVFPKLAVIRGHNLFKGYGLVIFLTNSLLQINLRSLMTVSQGSILLNRLYHACYINTIDWTYLTREKPTIALTNNECFSQACHPACINKNCWSSTANSCQLKCPNSCANNCHLDKVAECCQNELCMHCEHYSLNTTNTTNTKMADSGKCVSCSRFRDLNSGECVKFCPEDTLVYENHSCIRLSDCSRAKSSLIKGYHVLNASLCVRECPTGYLPTLNFKSNTSECVHCKDNVCKRDCSGRGFTLKSLFDLASVKNCASVKHLHIEFNNLNVSHDALKESLQYLEEIEEYLVIVRNRYVKKMSFLQSLRLIKGN